MVGTFIKSISSSPIPWIITTFGWHHYNFKGSKKDAVNSLRVASNKIMGQKFGREPEVKT